MKKQTVRKILIWLLKAFAASAISLAVLSVFAFFYNYTGIHITNTTGATDYTWLSYQRMNNMKEGFSFIKMDENGFNNTEYHDDIDILLMGSSHMEAYQVNQNQNCGFLLNDLMPEYRTYNIGVSGHTIYRIVDNIDSALKEYTPSKYVLIETNAVKLGTDMMNEVISGEASAMESHDSGLLFYLQKIPAFKPLYNQIDNWLNFKPDKTDSKSSRKTVISEEYRTVLSDFLGLIKNEAEKHGVTPVIFYSPNEYLNKEGEQVFQTNEKYLEVYKETCESLGIVFVDMTDSFESLFNEENTLAHGFSNTGVGLGHLNKNGHRVVALRLVEEIYKAEGR